MKTKCTPTKHIDNVYLTFLGGGSAVTCMCVIEKYRALYGEYPDSFNGEQPEEVSQYEKLSNVSK